MKLIVGLGNPGTKYAKTKHNAGFMVLDEFSLKHGLGFSYEERFFGEVALGNVSGERTVLLKPRTYMNESGRAVVAVVNFYKPRFSRLERGLVAARSAAFKDFSSEDIWVVHDDIDLELGRIKIQMGGGSAGHNGLISIIESVKNSDFVRFRLGVGRPIEPSISIEDFVLQEFLKDEEEVINKAIGRMAQAINTSLKEGIEKAMNEFN